MVKTPDNGALVPPFLLKCYEIVDDQSTDALISWSSNGDSFVILDVTEFEGELLPKYFKHKNFSSFIRQLNIYGFRKVDTDRWEFSNDHFIKGEKHLLKNICRRKQSQVVLQRKSKDKGVEACEEDRNIGLWKEVENLNTDKNALMQELSKLRQHQETSQSKVVVLREQLKGMEKNQQQMLSFIVMAMQSPGFFVQVVPPKENNWRMAEAGKNVLEPVTDNFELEPSDGMIVRYQPPIDQSPELVHTPTSDSENSLDLDLDLSSDEVKDLFMNMDFMSDPMGERFLSSENHGPIYLPDVPGDDSFLEQLLLTSSLSQNNEDIEYDAAKHYCSGIGTGSTPSGSHLHVSDKFEFTADTFKKPHSPKMDTAGLGTQLDESENGISYWANGISK